MIGFLLHQLSPDAEEFNLTYQPYTPGHPWTLTFRRPDGVTITTTGYTPEHAVEAAREKVKS